jgi:large subunit ribosomal protein L9
MKLLLTKTIDKLGIVGDVVNVKPGYARNYLLPHGLATEPTAGNVRRLAEARKQAELERIRQREMLEAYAKKIEGVEVTVRAKANEDGLLYGSVGPREIAAALSAEGHAVLPEHIHIASPIRHLDKVAVEVRLGEGIRTNINVWVVREKGEGEEGEPEQAGPAAGRTEAGSNDDVDRDG